MLDFYTRYYNALPRSNVYSEFCRRVYGADFGQHGFSNVDQIDTLIREVGLRPREAALDMGCGDGRITEYISRATGAQVTGIDFIPAAIERARARLTRTGTMANFVCGDLNAMDTCFPPGSFDVIMSIDTLYFGDLTGLVGQMRRLLRAGGRLGIFYSHGADPGNPIETFPRETLPHEKGPVAQALRVHGLSYRAWDFTGADYRHAQLAKTAIEQLLPECRTDDDRFLLENRLGEARGVMAACEAGCNSRYLFIAR